MFWSPQPKLALRGFGHVNVEMLCRGAPGCLVAALRCRAALKAECLLQVQAGAAWGAQRSARDRLGGAAGTAVMVGSALMVVWLLAKLVMSRLEAWRHRGAPGGRWVRDRSLGGKEVGDSREAGDALRRTVSLFTGFGQASNSFAVAYLWQLAACPLPLRLC